MSDPLIFILITSIAILNQQSSIFYIIYFFWWSELVEKIIDWFFINRGVKKIKNLVSATPE